MSKSAPTTTQQVDPAIRPYRDAFLKQAFSTAANQPLSFYGMQGSTPGPFPGMNPAQNGTWVSGVADRARRRGGRPGSPSNPSQIGDGGPMVPGALTNLMRDNPGGLSFGGGPGSGPNIGPGMPGQPPSANFGFGGQFGTQTGPNGETIGSIDPWVAGPSSYTTNALETPIQEQAKNFMNPYESSVVDAVRGDFGQQKKDALAMADDIATKSRAFGGSRHGVMAAKALEGINRSEASTLSNLRYGGYKDAMSNAFGDRSFMFGAGDYMRGLGQQGIDAARGRFDQSQNLPFQRLGFMQSALTGVPMGSQTTGPKPDIWSQFLGGAMTAGSFL